MKNLLLVLTILLFPFEVSSDFKSDIKINSNSIEFLKESNKINFLDNVEINSEYVNIKANSATYDQNKDVISFSGTPTLIKSKKMKVFLMEEQKKYYFLMMKKSISLAMPQ